MLSIAAAKNRGLEQGHGRFSRREDDYFKFYILNDRAVYFTQRSKRAKKQRALF
jgi:hypothetical protein